MLDIVNFPFSRCGIFLYFYKYSRALFQVHLPFNFSEYLMYRNFLISWSEMYWTFPFLPRDLNMVSSFLIFFLVCKAGLSAAFRVNPSHYLGKTFLSTQCHVNYPFFSSLIDGKRPSFQPWTVSSQTWALLTTQGPPAGLPVHLSSLRLCPVVALVSPDPQLYLINSGVLLGSSCVSPSHTEARKLSRKRTKQV